MTMIRPRSDVCQGLPSAGVVRPLHVAEFISKKKHFEGRKNFFHMFYTMLRN